MANTGLGKFLDDPLLKPFLDDLPRQIREEANTHPLGVLWIDLGVDKADFEDLTQGEVAWAIVYPKGGTPSRVFLADVAGRNQQVDALLQKITVSMNEQNAVKSESDVGGAKVTVFDIPATGNLDKRKLLHVVKKDRLIITESIDVAKAMMDNLDRDSGDTLANQKSYQQVIKECKQRAGDETPDAILFLVPLSLSEAIRELAPKNEDGSLDRIEIARQQSFDTISGLGSFITVDKDAFDFRLRTYIYAPRPWKNAMRICKFPNQELQAVPWVGEDNNVYTLMNVDFSAVSKYVGPLFDDLIGGGEEGLFDDLKNTLREDPDGPQIDIDNDLFGNLSPQIVLLAHHQLPATPTSTQRLIALSCTDEAGVAEMVKKIMEFDTNTEIKQIAGKQAFFTYIEEESESFGDQPSQLQDQAKSPAFITCVANGFLMFATDEQILSNALESADGNSMSQNVDYKSLESFFQQFGDQTNLRIFRRIGESIRVDYELARQGTMPASGKTFEGLLSNIMAGEPPADKSSSFDGSKLPAFEQVEKYFGLAGIVGKETPNGWFLDGIVLKKK